MIIINSLSQIVKNYSSAGCGRNATWILSFYDSLLSY